MGVKKDSKWNRFVKNLGFKYRASLIEQDTLKEVWFVRVSRFSLLLFLLSFFLLSFVISALVFLFLPVEYYFPEKEKLSERLPLIHQTLQIDSLEREVEMQANLLDLIQRSIRNESLKESDYEIDTLKKQIKIQPLMKKSKSELEFVKEYEETEKYNLSSIPTKPSEKTLIFFKPVEGIIVSSYLPTKNRYGVSIITSSQKTVKSVLEGSVIFAEYTFSNDWVVQVQHQDNYVSVYKNNTKLLKHVGDKVKAGEGLAITGNRRKKEEKKYFYFELWKKGNPINPEEVITF